MQTILGAGGPIADELARELHRNFTTDIRLVSRRPKQVNGTDELVAADLMDPVSTERAVAGSEIAYLTVGLPMDSALWEEKFPVMMRNVIDACKVHGTKLVFFDNTYMYPGTPAPQTESTGFAPGGRKGRVRAEIVTMLLEEMKGGRSRRSSVGLRSSTGRGRRRAGRTCSSSTGSGRASARWCR